MKSLTSFLAVTLLVFGQIRSKTDARRFRDKYPSLSMTYSTPQYYSSVPSSPTSTSTYSYVSSVPSDLKGSYSSNTIIGNGNFQCTGFKVLGNADQPLNVLSLKDLLEAVLYFFN